MTTIPSGPTREIAKAMYKATEDNAAAASQKLKGLNNVTVETLSNNQAEIDRTVEKIKARKGEEPGPLSRGMKADVQA